MVGDYMKLIGYAAIFFLLWLEVRGLKKSVNNLTTTIGNSFAAGEKRFDTIEHNVLELDHRLAAIEKLQTQRG